MQYRNRLKSSPCRLEHDNGMEFNIQRRVTRSQRVDSDGVGAMVLGANNLIEFSDALQSTFHLSTPQIRALFFHFFWLLKALENIRLMSL